MLDRRQLVWTSTWGAWMKNQSMNQIWHLRHKQALTLLLVCLACWNRLEIASGSEVHLLHSEVAAFQKRLDMIASAQSTIEVGYYEIDDDDTCGQFLIALQRATERGVKVRFLTDGNRVTNAMPKALMDYCIDRGILIRERPVDARYRPELGHPRIHDKLLIIDRCQLLTGGRNLTREYFGLGCTRSIDRDVYVAGQAACCAAEYFDARWQEPGTAQPTLCGPDNPKYIPRHKHPEWNCMDRCEAKEQIAIWLAQCEVMELQAQEACPCTVEFPAMTIEDCKTKFLHDIVCGSKRDEAAIAQQLISRLQQARCSIDLQTPYFVISHRMHEVLTEKARKGVRVRVLTNSLESSDSEIVHAGFANQRRGLLRAGVEIFEYQGRDVLHAKAMIVDSHICMVGSYNFDMLSERRNSEVALVVDDREYARQLSQSLGIHRQRSLEVKRLGLFRYEARESDAPDDKIKKYQRSRLIAPLAKPFL
jgi:cardiolipin synthase C